MLHFLIELGQMHMRDSQIYLYAVMEVVHLQRHILPVISIRGLVLVKIEDLRSYA